MEVLLHTFFLQIRYLSGLVKISPGRTGHAPLLRESVKMDWLSDFNEFISGFNYYPWEDDAARALRLRFHLARGRSFTLLSRMDLGIAPVTARMLLGQGW